MTEFWKSNPMHWCDLCKCWLQDTKQARLNHERGATHAARLAQKLRDMAKKADTDKAQKAANDSAMSRIDEQARKQYEKDKAAAAAAAEAVNGKWSWEEESGYYYNAVHKWYYDPKTQWYYGGSPVAWIQAPSIPAAAMFGAAPHTGGPVPQGSKPAAPAAVTTSQAAGSGPSTSGTAAAAGGGITTTVKRVVAVPKHPMANIGGYQAPTTGKVGGAKGAGITIEDSDNNAKRKREEPGAKPGGGKGGGMSAEEAEALARREAARQRVAARTASQFGYM